MSEAPNVNAVKASIKEIKLIDYAYDYLLKYSDILVEAFDDLNEYTQSTFIQSVLYASREEFDSIKDNFKIIIDKAKNSTDDWVKKTAETFEDYPNIKRGVIDDDYSSFINPFYRVEKDFEPSDIEGNDYERMVPSNIHMSQENANPAPKSSAQIEQTNQPNNRSAGSSVGSGLSKLRPDLAEKIAALRERRLNKK